MRRGLVIQGLQDMLRYTAACHHEGLSMCTVAGENPLEFESSHYKTHLLACKYDCSLHHAHDDSRERLDTGAYRMLFISCHHTIIHSVSILMPHKWDLFSECELHQNNRQLQSKSRSLVNDTQQSHHTPTAVIHTHLQQTQNR